MADLPDPVGLTTSVSRPESTASMARPALRAARPNRTAHVQAWQLALLLVSYAAVWSWRGCALLWTCTGDVIVRAMATFQYETRAKSSESYRQDDRWVSARPAAGTNGY